MIPPFFTPPENSLDVTPIPLKTPSQVIDRGARPNDAGLFSAFTSYIQSYAADDPPEPSDEELESTLCTVDCVNSCYLGDVFANIINMPIDGLQALVQSLLLQIPEDSTTAVIVVKPEVVIPTPVNGQKHPSDDTEYDPATVYLLELCTVLALRDQKTVELLGRDVAEALQNVIRDTPRHHSITVSRCAFYLLNLLHASYVSS